MRVVIDWHPARTHAPGSGRYLRELTRALAEVAGREDELVRLDWGRGADAELPADAHGAATSLRLVRRAWPRRWSGWCDALGSGPGSVARGGIVHTARPDLAGRRSTRASLAVAELPRDPAVLAAWRRRAQAAELLFVFSPVWRERVARTLGADIERVHAVPVGCEHWARHLGTPPERGQDLLILGARTSDGGHLELARAARELRRQGWPGRLVCAGRPGSADGALRAEDPRADWLVLSTPAEAELPRLVAAAGALVHLVPDPGTPVTPLEGLALGTPVLCRRSAVLEAALGQTAEWCADEEMEAPVELAAKLAGALGARPGQGGRELVARHSWRASAEAHLACWRGSRPRA